MAHHHETYGLRPETPSRFVVDSTTTPGLWSLGLKTGLTPQHLAPLSTGTHHKLEVNPFEQSYAHVAPRRSLDEGIREHLRRPRINELQNMGAGPSKDSSSSTDSRSSNESRMSVTTLDTPPSDVPHSPQAIKSMAGASMLGLDSNTQVMPMGNALPNQNGPIDAGAYAEHLARYVQAQAVHATRTSAPLAGQSTSKPIAAFGHALDEADVLIDSPSASSHNSPQSDSMAPTFSSMQESYTSEPRKKTSPVKAALPVKRGKVGRPRNVKEEEGEELTLEEVKRRDFLERNRQAACKSRQKRKAWQANLESEASRLTESNGQLQALVASLREEIASLRATVAGHAANGCQAARLALQAARPGDVPMAAFVLPPSPSVAMHSPIMHAPGDMMIGHLPGVVDGAIAYHHPSAIEAQRSASHQELTASYSRGAGVPFFDVAAAAGLSNGSLGRSSDVDLSVYLA